MLHTKNVLTICAASILLYSCGTGKKLQAANAQVEEMTAANSKLTASNASLQKQLDQQTANITKAKEDLAVYMNECEANKKKLALVRAGLTDLQSSMDEVEKKLETALADFVGKGVEVYEKDGFVYVNMQDNLLYKSGSAALSTEGKKALGAVASALNDYPKLKVYVVGNTDDQKFKKGNSDNLSLSTERANGVFRVLRDDYKVDPSRMVAAGKGKYAPVAENTSEEGRAKNRRTEIILNPDLVKLFENAQAN